jgi:hypothetical protein
LASSVDVSRSSVARTYDYYLGGKDDFDVAQAAVNAIMVVVPEQVGLVASNRAFPRCAGWPGWDAARDGKPATPPGRRTS